MKFIIFVALALIITACNAKDTHPEHLDVIYGDLMAELALVSSALAAEEAELSGFKNELALAVPQTGQIKYINKKISDSLEKINVLTQRKQYFKIKVEQRLLQAHARYEESLIAGGKPWPDQQEISLYKSVVKFQRDRFSWEKTKGTKKIVPRGTEK